MFTDAQKAFVTKQGVLLALGAGICPHACSNKRRLARRSTIGA
ncbi:hypothetical protein [Altererythrobacter sp. KTW20L]|nr:hypothetical protein [Altererythrobacter sp. KTW20L]